ncbi:hypothetical protein GKC29_25290 [Micromonospora sp. WMMC415]|nr:hypothetical protein GKC29_25290 [Micromonospora sp. WMMC415]
MVRGRGRRGSGRRATPGGAPNARGPIGAAGRVIPAPRTRARIDFNAGQPGAWNRTVNRRKLQPNTTYVERTTGYTYKTDSKGRVTHFSGRLQAVDGHRNAYQQRVAGRPFRKSTDQGGHLFAHIFRGPGERINLVAMDSNLNLSAWKRMENRWARALDPDHPTPGAGSQTVRVEGRVHYDPNSASTRPTAFTITEQIDNGPKRTHRFRNP